MPRSTSNSVPEREREREREGGGEGPVRGNLLCSTNTTFFGERVEFFELKVLSDKHSETYNTQCLDEWMDR